MTKAPRQPPNTRTAFRTIWGELEFVCNKVHHSLHEQGDMASARRYRRRLKQLLEELHGSDSAILREEGIALLHELNEENVAALRHRQKEIQLTERLHESVRLSVEAGDYDDRMAASILAHRDAAVLRKRRAIVKALSRKVSAETGKTANGRNEGHRRKHPKLSIDDLLAAKKLVGQVGSIKKARKALAALARLG